MAEIRTEVKTFRIDSKCEKCKDGYMICIKKNMVDGEPRSKHQCNNDDCQVIAWISGDPYPRIVHEPTTALQHLAAAGTSVKEALKSALAKTPKDKKSPMTKKRETIKKKPL